MSDPKGSAPTSPLDGRRVLLGVTGGIAAYKACFLARLLISAGAEVQVVMSEAATHFIGPDTFAALTGRPVHCSLWEEPGSVLHVKLAREADLAVVAPATANTIAKLARGEADDLLTSTLLEVQGPIVVAPAMHTGMVQNPATQENIKTLAERGVRIAGPVVGALAAGDEGPGRMSEPQDIFDEVEAAAGRGRDLEGRRILVTAGPTWEPIDPVRFIGNRSTGKMGFAIVREAVARGAEVTLVLGPGTAHPPSGVTLVPVATAEDMRSGVIGRLGSADAVVMAAAVADFRPSEVAAQKIKKGVRPPEIALEQTPDILAEVASLRTEHQVIVGFAAETGDLESAGREKLERKALDLIVVNEVGRGGTGFGSDTNDAMILSGDVEDEPLRTWTKAELARAICDRLVRLLGG